MNGLPAFDPIPDPLPLARFARSAPQPSPRLLTLADLEQAHPRHRVRRSRIVAFIASLLWLGAHLAAYGIRGDLHQLSGVYVALQIVLPFLLAATTLVFALRPGPLGLGIDLRWGGSWAALAPLVFWWVALAASPPYAPAHDPQRWLHILLCLDLTLTFTALPLLAAVLGLRQTFAGGARLRATLVGASAGLFAGATMNLHCPNVDALHVALGHGVPVLVAILFGWLVVAHTARA